MKNIKKIKAVKNSWGQPSTKGRGLSTDMRIQKQPLHSKNHRKKPSGKSVGTAIAHREHRMEDKTRQVKIKIIGIGGGGCSIVSELAVSLKKYEFITANTDIQALKKNSKFCKRFQFAQNLTKGLGCGMNPDLGEKGAEQEKEKIKKLLQGADFCVLISCLGGGAGSGATPIFAEICKELDIVSLGIFFTPFKFEGEKKAKIASNALEKIKPNLNSLVVISNDKIFQIVEKDISLEKSLSALNKILEKGLQGLIEMIYLPGLINIDWADLKTILQGRGKLCYLSCIEDKKDKGVKEIVKMVLANPLSEYSILGAEKILYNIASDKNLTMEEVKQISVSITDFNPKAKIIFGVAQSPKYKGKIRIALFASGCGTPEKPVHKIARKEKIAPVGTALDSGTPLAQRERSVPVGANTKTPTTSKKTSGNVPVPPVPPISPKILSGKTARTSPSLKRKNALDIRKEVEQVEKDILEQETKWDTPAFLRNKKDE